MSRSFLMLALFCALCALSTATAPAIAQDSEISAENAEYPAPEGDNDHLGTPSYIIPTRSGVIPQDQDSPQTNKRRWARPADHTAEQPAPANTSFPE